MSKFLFVSTYDLRRNTSGNIRTVALMKSLHDNGHTVHCIFVPTNNVSDTNIFNNLIEIDKIFTFPRTPVSCITNTSTSGKIVNDHNTIKSRFRTQLINLYSSLSVYDVFALQLIKLKASDLSELDDDYDYIISSSEPRSSHKFAKKIIQFKKLTAKWILYWGDPMSNDVASNKLFSGLEAAEEKKLIAMSDGSIYTNPCASRYMKKKYPELESKIDWVPTTDFHSYSDDLCKGDVSQIGYFGDYRQMYRNIIPFYESCVENNFSTIIMGGSDLKLQSKAKVTVMGRMSRDVVSEYEKKCGILVVLENISKTGECIQVPGKLYHYGLTYKHILVITESINISKDYDQYHRFVFVPNDKSKIAEAIKKIQTGATNMADSIPVPDFEYNKISKLFLEKLSKLSNNIDR